MIENISRVHLFQKKYEKNQKQFGPQNHKICGKISFWVVQYISLGFSSST